jgi:transcriptional regulator with PAS, ATPase and Fis domain
VRVEDLRICDWSRLGMERMKRNVTRVPANLRRAIKPWRETERREIVRTLKIAKKNKTLAATLLGIGKTTMYKKTAKS